MDHRQPQTTKQPRLLWGAAAVAVICVLSAWVARSSRAADDSQAFVEGLCQRQFFDTAADFLQSQAANPNLCAQAKATIPYQQAVVFTACADQAVDAPSRDANHRRAIAKFQEFLAASPDHELAAAARDRLGNQLLTLADGELAQANARQAALRSQAGADYAAARAAFEDSAQRLRGQLDKLPTGEQREELGSQWLGASVNAGRATFFIALAADPGSKERHNLLTDAAAQCGSLYVKYPKRLGGGVAHFYEARANEELGDDKQALAAYIDLIDQLSDSEAAARSLKTQAVLRAQHFWLQDKNYDALVEKTLAWAKSAHGAELQDADWLQIKLSVAMALQKLATLVSRNDPKATSYSRDARSLATEVLNSKNIEFQGPAQELLTQLGHNSDAAAARQALSPHSSSSHATAATPHETLQLAADTRQTTGAAPATADSDNANVTSFDQAYDKASDATEDVKSIQVELEFSRQETPPDTKHIAELEATQKTKREEAYKLCQLAVSLANSATNIEKLNQVRYWLCWFQYAKGNYYDAALLGEFLARKYPKSASALPGVQVALTSFDALYRERKQAGANDLSFETNHLLDFANYVIGRWPDDAEVARALQMLMAFAIEAGDYDKAQAIINKAPADSLARLEGEAKLGQALWVKYLRTAQQLRQQKAATADGSAEAAPAPDDPQSQQKQDALLKQAQAALQQGIDGLRKQDSLDEGVVLPALSLAQLYLNAGNADKALALLEDTKIGPLTLLKNKAPATQSENVAAEIYKTAVHAYIAAVPQQLDNAMSAMDALDKLYAHDPDGAARSMQTLVDIAFGLEQKLDDLNNHGETEKAQATVQAFEKFLNKISQRQATADYKTLNWIAATYESLAKGLNPGGSTDANHASGAETNSVGTAKLSPEAQENLQQAVKAYEAIVSKAKDNADFMPADKLPAIQRRLALDYRSLGQYDQSIALFAALLKDKPNLLPVQVEAAYTYQWGGKNGNPDFYVAAIVGGRGPSASIWGWNKIGQNTSRNDHFRDSFHEARYNMVLCRVEFSATRTKDDEKRKLLELAKDTIRDTKRFEATMGGTKWKPLYEKLLREIQKDLDEPVIGLLEFESRDGDSPTKDEKK